MIAVTVHAADVLGLFVVAVVVVVAAIVERIFGAKPIVGVVHSNPRPATGLVEGDVSVVVRLGHLQRN